MKSEVLYQAINKETKYYGLKLFGIAIGFISCLVFWLIINVTAGIFASVGGYTFGSYVSGLLHRGLLQRWVHWNLPLSLGGSYIPPSRYRTFM